MTISKTATCIITDITTIVKKTTGLRVMESGSAIPDSVTFSDFSKKLGSFMQHFFCSCELHTFRTRVHIFLDCQLKVDSQISIL